MILLNPEYRREEAFPVGESRVSAYVPAGCQYARGQKGIAAYVSDAKACRRNVQWTFRGHVLTRRARQYPGTSSAIARIVSVSELRELL